MNFSQERLVELTGDDEPLGGVARLSGVLEPGTHRRLNGRVQIVGSEEDERVRAAQFQNHLLEISPGDLRNRRAGALGPGQRHPPDARVGDHPLDLLVRRIDVDVRICRETGLVEDLLDRRRRLRALWGMLEEDRVADHQIRTREPRHLVVRIVPRHDPQQHALRATAYERRSLPRQQLDRFIGHQLLGIVGIEAVDVDTEVDLTERLLDRLSHLSHDDLRQSLALLAVQLTHPPNQSRSLPHRGHAGPVAMSLVRPGDRVPELLIADRRILLDGLPRRRIDHRIHAHTRSSLSPLTAKPSPAPTTPLVSTPTRRSTYEAYDAAVPAEARHRPPRPSQAQLTTFRSQPRPRCPPDPRDRLVQLVTLDVSLTGPPAVMAFRRHGRRNPGPRFETGQYWRVLGWLRRAPQLDTVRRPPCGGDYGSRRAQ